MNPVDSKSIQSMYVVFVADEDEIHKCYFETEELANFFAESLSKSGRSFIINDRRYDIQVVK